MKTGFIQFSPEFGKAEANLEKALSVIEKADTELIISCDWTKETFSLEIDNTLSYSTRHLGG